MEELNQLKEIDQIIEEMTGDEDACHELAFEYQTIVEDIRALYKLAKSKGTQKAA